MLLSKIKVPNGKSEARNAITVFLKPQFKFIFTVIKASTYSTKSNPCTQPTYFTASGNPAKYFKGIAINKRTIKEIPSEMAASLNLPIALSENLKFILINVSEKITVQFRR